MSGEIPIGSPRVAVIGCGHWGLNHVRVFHELGRLAAVCDTDPSRLETARQRFPVDARSDPAEIFARPDLDAVALATPASTHVELAARALEAGKDVLVEKPISLDVAGGEKLVSLAADKRRVLMVGHVLEYHPAVLKLRELIRAGDLGRIRYLCSNRLNLGRIRTEENALWSFAPHDIALMIRLTGGEPELVSCHGGAYLKHDVADVTLTALRFADNVRGHIFVSWLHPFKEQRFIVVGERQMAVFDDTLDWPGKLSLYPHSVDWIEGKIPVARKAEGVAVACPVLEPLKAQNQHFVECVSSRAVPLTDGLSGLRALRVLRAAQESLRLGGAPVAAQKCPAPSYWAHPTAQIDVGAEIGSGTRVWHFSHVMPKARLGRDCVLGQNVFVANHVRVGDGVKIQNNVSVYEGVELEDQVFCGPSMVFTNVINPRSAIERKDEFRPTKVKKGATLGANSTILCGVTVGRHAMVGAGAVVTRDVPDHAQVTGVPARISGWVCECGVGLKFEPVDETSDKASCPACGRGYKRTLGAGGLEPPQVRPVEKTVEASG